MNYQRFKNALRDHGKVNLIDSLIVLGIANPADIVSDLRKKYGYDCIDTEHEIVKTLQGNPFKCRVYRLSASGMAKMFPVRKTFPSWNVFFSNQSK